MHTFTPIWAESPSVTLRVLVEEKSFLSVGPTCLPLSGSSEEMNHGEAGPFVTCLTQAMLSYPING